RGPEDVRDRVRRLPRRRGPGGRRGPRARRGGRPLHARVARPLARRPAGRQARHRHAEPAALRRGPRRARRVADDPEVALRTPTEATMRFTSQTVAYPFFATCLLLLSLQIVYGFVMAFAHMGYDVLHDWIPFNAGR